MKEKSFKIGIDARMFSDAFTGIGRYNFELTKRLFEHKTIEGRSLEWVIFLNQPQFDAFEFPEHVKKVCVNAGHYSLAEQGRFCWLLYKERCDFVHFTHFNLPLFYGRRFMVTIHDTTISFYPGKKMNAWWRKLAYQLVIRHAIKASAQIVTVSQHTKNDVVKLFKTNEKKITPIHIAPSAEFKVVGEPELLAVRRKFNIEYDFLLYTGNWREHKNLVGLIKAFAALKKQASFKDLKLIITGKADLHYPEVKDTIAQLQLKNSIDLVGLVSLQDLVGLFNAATVYVCPSFYEGFGLPPLEAMACATPVAVSRAASIPEVCGEAAVYFDPHNTADMTAEITNLLLDKNLQNTLKNKGLTHAATFDWDQTAHQTFDLYKKVLAV